MDATSAASAEGRADRQLGFLWLATALALILLSPLARLLAAPSLWSCPFKSLTGLPCPACGTTRAAFALARFDFSEAFLTHPLPAIVWTLFLAGGLAAGWLAWRRRPLPRIRRLPLWSKAAIVGAVVLNWIYSIATGV